jgi:replicative DNA helicase
MTPLSDNRLYAEREVVGRLILGADIAEASLQPDDFKGGGTRWLFSRIQALSKKGDPIEPNSLLANLESRTGVADEISQCMGIATTNSNLGFYVRQLKGMIAEEKKQAVQRETGRLLTDGGDIRAAMQSAAAELEKIEAEYGTADNETLADGAFRLIDGIENGRENPEQILTGLNAVDDSCVGLVGGDLVILAARPSMGKTALAVTIAVNLSKRGVKSMFFSMEQSSMSLANRVLAGLAGRSTSKALRRPQDINLSERADLLGYAGEILKVSENIMVSERPRLAVTEVEARSSKAVKAGARLIIVDYLGLMYFPGKQRHDIELSDACERLKALGKCLHVPIILLCQLNRGNEKENRKPRLSDLKDSGGIEQVADFVWFLHCPEEEAKKSGPKWFLQTKGRDAGVGARKLYFCAESVSFHDCELGENPWINQPRPTTRRKPSG